MKAGKYLIQLVILMLLTVSCTRKDMPDYQPIMVKEIRIGALLSLTGEGSSAGKSSQVSLEFALEDIRGYLAASGIQEKITLVTLDSKSDTAEALKQTEIFYKMGIRLIIGPYSNEELASVKNFADTHGMLMISPSSDAGSLALPDDNVFRFVCSNAIQGEVINKMFNEDKIKVIIPLIRDDLWGNDQLTATQNDFTISGGDVKAPVKYEPGTTVFSSALSHLDATVASELDHHKPNEVAVYLLSCAEGVAILREAKNYTNLNIVYWYGGSGLAQNTSVLTDTNAALFAYTHGLPCPIFGLEDAAKYRWQPLRDRIQGQIGRIPDVYSFTAYDALWVSVMTYITTGISPDITLLKSVFINESANFFGASGNTVLDENGDRAFGTFDFWAVKSDSTGYTWKRIAKYNSVTGILIRINE